jgi:hypothetical protein
MAIGKNTGATFGTVATLPTTYDDNATTGYASLTFVDCGEVVEHSEVGRVWALATHQAVGREYPNKIKDTYDIPNITLTLGRNTSDAGQVLLQAAEAASASYSFEVELPNGNQMYFTGKVLKCGLGAVAVGSVSQTMVEIAVDPETLFADEAA